MIILPKGLSGSELIKYLVTNKQDLIELKKAAVKFADPFLIDSLPVNTLVSKVASSANDTDSEIKRTIVGNTYNWLDSHGDVHLNGCFKDSLNQKGDRVRHLHDHVYQLSAKVGIPSKVYEKYIAWTDLGVNKIGQTQALMMDTLIKRSLNEPIFEGYKSGEIDQHSVGMRYISIKLAANNPDYKEEYAEWLKHIDSIGNKEKAEEIGYFWAVKEAALIEISCVLEGSNELTPMLDPSKGSQSTVADPPSGSQETQVKTILDYLVCQE